ncbi:MAG: hypothetical protein PF503_15370 [Desulfobacula sp.]|nr:hypothetical protein [Desulfobacula sp.]
MKNENYSDMHSEQLEKEGLYVKSDGDTDQVVYSKNNPEEFKVIKDRFDKLEEIYLKLKDGSLKEKEALEDVIKNFENDTGYWVKKTHDSIKLGGQISIYSQKTKNDSRTIRTARRRFLSSLEKKTPVLYQYFNSFLKVDSGLLFDPPDDQPQWEVIFPS